MKLFKKLSYYFGEFAILPIKLYQVILSPIIGRDCRYQPTCSNYAIEAIRKKGVLKGVYMGLIRIIKCNPFGGKGYDPVDKNNSKI